MRGSLTITDLQRGIHWERKEMESGPVNCVCQISVYPAVRRQRIAGFGGAFTEAAAYAYGQLTREKQRELMECYFGEAGLRYRLGRVHMNSCDFSLTNYACVEDPSDETLKTFHTDRDDRYLIPMVLDAQRTAGEPVGLLLSPWSPPGFMKTNGEMNNGGRLKPEYRFRWAECMAKYAAHYRGRGCDVRLMSVQNEPAAVQTWDSCLYSAAEEGAFALEALAPALEREGCGDVRILVWDHNKESLVQRAAGAMAVPGASAAIAGFAVHWYTGDHFEALKLVKEEWPDKEIWFSEGCVEYSRFGGMTPVQKAEMYAHDMLGNLSAGISGSFDWNLLVDAAGGPNHAGNFCEAPVMLNAAGDDFERKGAYYYIGHFSRFIRPGAIRLGSSVYDSRLETVVFENTDGVRTAVMLNRTDAGFPVCLSQDGVEGFTFTLAPHTIGTLEWQDRE